MATRTDRFMTAAVRAAMQAKRRATAVVREADRLLREAKRQAESEGRRRPRLKQALLETGRVMKAAGRAALFAAVATGIAAAFAGRRPKP